MGKNFQSCFLANENKEDAEKAAWQQIQISSQKKNMWNCQKNPTSLCIKPLWPYLPCSRYWFKRIWSQADQINYIASFGASCSAVTIGPLHKRSKIKWSQNKHQINSSWIPTDTCGWWGPHMSSPLGILF